MPRFSMQKRVSMRAENALSVISEKQIFALERDPQKWEPVLRSRQTPSVCAEITLNQRTTSAI